MTVSDLGTFNPASHRGEHHVFRTRRSALQWRDIICTDDAAEHQYADESDFDAAVLPGERHECDGELGRLRHRSWQQYVRRLRAGCVDGGELHRPDLHVVEHDTGHEHVDGDGPLGVHDLLLPCGRYQLQQCRELHRDDFGYENDGGISRDQSA